MLNENQKLEYVCYYCLDARGNKPKAYKEGQYGKCKFCGRWKYGISVAVPKPA